MLVQWSIVFAGNADTMEYNCVFVVGVGYNLRLVYRAVQNQSPV